MIPDGGWWDVSKMVYCEIQEAHVFHISRLGRFHRETHTHTVLLSAGNKSEKLSASVQFLFSEYWILYSKI